MSESVIERLTSTNPDLEVWWDSSPLVFEPWVKSMVDAAPAETKTELESQLRRLYNAKDPANSVFRGCTTNPPLSLKAVTSDPDFWNGQVDELSRENPKASHKEIAWMVYKRVIARGAEMYKPIWDTSEGRYGWISGQLDPRQYDNKEVMFEQGAEIAALHPNVMVKVPASTQGVEVVKYLASRGISTNVTTCFTMSQIVAMAKAARDGAAIAKKNGVDQSRWRTIITHMLGRLTEQPALVEQGARRGVEISLADRKWFGLAVFKNACRFLAEGAYPSKMLVCSVRSGPLVSGRMRYWDVEELAGGDMIFTMPPSALEPMFKMGDDLDFRPYAIDEDVPEESLDRVLQTPYGIQSFDPNGLSLEQFNTHPATLYTVTEFNKAANGFDEFVAQRLAVTGAAVR